MSGANVGWAHVADRFGGEVTVLEPPYRGVLPLPPLAAGADPPPGAIAVGRGAHVIAVLAQLTTVVHHWPWMIPCLVVDRGDEPIEPLAILVSELHGRLAVVKWRPGQTHPDAAQILLAVRDRPAPTCGDLAQWVARRVRQSDLEIPLRSQFREALERVPASRDASISTYSRLFARYGRFTARDWRALALLCLHAVSGGSEAPLAPSCRKIPLRRATLYTRKYLCQSQRVLEERVGWEWVLETGLRAGGYV